MLLSLLRGVNYFQDSETKGGQWLCKSDVRVTDSGCRQSSHEVRAYLWCRSLVCGEHRSLKADGPLFPALPPTSPVALSQSLTTPLWCPLSSGDKSPVSMWPQSI